MSQPIAFLNGKFLPADQLVVQPQDMGFMLGVTVAEQLRTFCGDPFLLQAHVDRLADSLQILGVSISLAEVVSALEHVAKHNYALLDPSCDLGITVFVTPGLYPTYCPDGKPTPNVGIHTYPLPFALWADKYAAGQRCMVSHTPQVNAACWPRELKCRSRVHYYLADQAARTQHPASRAILLDEVGNVNEASTANVVAYFEDQGLVSPPRGSILPGISLGYLESLAGREAIPFTYRVLSAAELAEADEILLTSTPFCVLPVSHLDDRTITQRACFQRILTAWSERVDIDIALQAKRFA